MSATTNRTTDWLVPLTRREHNQCFVCGDANPQGLHILFHGRVDGSVIAEFPCASLYRGYDGLLHGGIISCLLDGAMTNCLFAHGVTATTGDLAIRFLHPVKIETPVTVTARLVRSRLPLYVLEAELAQDQTLMARSTGKFMGMRRVEPTI